MISRCDFGQRRTWTASLIGTSVGSLVAVMDLSLRPSAYSNDYLGALSIIWPFSMLAVLLVTIFVEALTMLIRPSRNMLALAGSLLIAAAISLPFLPREFTGGTTQPGDFRTWHAAVYAFVTALVWWFHLPEKRADWPRR